MADLGWVDILIIGGGASGFFAAITAAEAGAGKRVVLLERSGRFLSKVKISGGGRCNVTHACFDPRRLATHYPRGERELRGAFYHWQPRDTMEWFAKRGVSLKTESDGRVFPVSDSSQTIIECLLHAARSSGVQIHQNREVQEVLKSADGFQVNLRDRSFWRAGRVGVLVGSLKDSALSRSIEQLGHQITPLVPSLFAFHVEDTRLTGLQGVAVENAVVRVAPGGRPQQGALLITHQGFSGPAILRLSAWEARLLKERDYSFEVQISWLPNKTREGLLTDMLDLRTRFGSRLVRNSPIAPLPRRLWEHWVEAAGVGPSMVWAQLARPQQNELADQLLKSVFRVHGKSMNKEEFVTCGGVDRREVDFKTMESRLVPGLYFGGECLDIDGITGGFNFQAAWTTGYLAGRSMAKTEDS